MNLSAATIALLITVILGSITDALKVPLITSTTIKINLKELENTKKYTVVAKEWNNRTGKAKPRIAFKKQLTNRGIFTISGLTPNQDYQITVLEHQTKGRKVVERDVKKTKPRCKCSKKDCPTFCQPLKRRGCSMEELPDKGNMTLRCTRGNKVNSVCIWGCPEGFKIKELRYKRTKCMKNRTWSSSRRPECLPKAPRCNSPPESPKNGFVECLGERCTYKCKDRFLLKGYTSTQCKKNEITGVFEWDRKNETFCEPTCKDLDDGSVNCSSTEEGSTICSFTCDPGFKLSHEQKLLCQNGEWSGPAPTCQPVCSDMEPVNNGMISCNGSGIGSKCSLQCDKSFIARSSQATCKVGRDGKAAWSPSKYFCCAKCVFNDYVRLVIAIDDSQNEKESDWRKVVDFIQYVISKLHNYGFTVNVGVIAYGVEQHNIVQLHKIKTRKNIEDISRALLKFKTSSVERVSNQGAAMEFAYNEMLSDLNHHEEEPFLLFTAAKTSDDEIMEKVRTISEKDVNILAVGLNEGVSDSYLNNISTNGYTARIRNGRERMKVVYKINEMCRLYGCAMASRTNKCT